MSSHQSQNDWPPSGRTRKEFTYYRARLGRLLDRLLQQKQAAEEGQPRELERDERGVEEEARPSQENTMSKVRPDCEAMAQNLRLRTEKVRLAEERITVRQDKKNNALDLCREADMHNLIFQKVIRRPDLNMDRQTRPHH